MPSAAASFTDIERQRVNDAVVAAEQNTSAEIMAVVATASGRYDRAEDMAGLWLGIAALSIAWLAFQTVSIEWDQPELGLGLVSIVLILLGGFVLGAIIAANVGWVRRLFTPRGEMMLEVNARARQVFFDYRIRHTAQRGGVLLYVSLFERIAVVLADEVAGERLSEGAVEQLCAQLTERLRSGGNIADAIADTIRAAGERLAPVLPRQPGDVNELPDLLVTID
jgi:putative membrane protein